MAEANVPSATLRSPDAIALEPIATACVFEAVTLSPSATDDWPEALATLPMATAC